MAVEERVFEGRIKKIFGKLIGECLERNVGWRNHETGICRLSQSPFAKEYCGCEYLNRDKGLCTYKTSTADIVREISEK